MIRKVLKLSALIAYLSIILMGSVIGLPLVFWLFFTLFDFGNEDQLFALMGVLGLLLNYKIWNLPRTLKVCVFDILIFILLCLPLVRRMSVVPIEKFGYLGFIIPSSIFVVLYVVSIFISLKANLTQEKQFSIKE